MDKYEPVIAAAELLCDKAAKLDKDGFSDKSLAFFENVLAKFPLYPRAQHAKGILLHKLGYSDKSLSVLYDCLERNPTYLDAWCSLGNIYRSLYDFNKALECYEKILSKDSTYFLAYFSIAEIKHKEQEDSVALTYYRKAVKFNKSFIPAYLGIIRIYKTRSKLIEAERLCRKILKFEPNNSEALFMIGAVRAEYGDIPEAIRYMEMVRNSDKFGLSAHASIIYYLNLLPETQQEQIYRESVSFEEKFAIRYRQFQIPHANSPLLERKIRIGFVSGDLKLHPVARHLRPLIQNLDREHFELYAYNNFNVHDLVTQEFKELFCYWRNIHEISDEKAVEMVRLDTIDILFDLAAYTGSSRLMMFARKPAPIQISWIGYFNTTGFRTMDYLLSDAITIRPEEDCWFTEKIIRMPHSRFCYDPRVDILPEVGSLPAAVNGRITFGAFNKVNKLNDQVLKTWSRILLELPDARLILKWPAYKDKTAVESVSFRFTQFGITPDRLEFRPESGYVELLREYTSDIDIVLDTFPHSGGATTCDALSTGVPVITLSGSIPISRQTHGFLNLMGLEKDLVAFSIDEYVGKALALARDIPRLVSIRNGLRHRFISSQLCNGAAFTRDFEVQMRSIWRTWCKDKSIPDVLSQQPLVSSEVYNEGINLMGGNFYPQAALYFRKTIELEPRNDKAMNNLAICLWESGDLEEAEQILRRARRINPLNDDVYCNLSGVLISKDKRASLKYAEMGIRLTDCNMDLYINQAFALMELSRLSESMSVLSMIAKRFPPSAKVMGMTGNCYAAMGKVEEARRFLLAASKFDPSDASPHSNLLFTMNNSEKCTQKDIYREALRWNKQHAISSRVLPSNAANKKNAKLRIGLVSADFREHPGGMLLKPFMANYDRSALEVYCYFNHHKYDSMTVALHTYADAWREVLKFSDMELFDQIRADDIDILIDMNGHTDKNRLRLFSMKPCAVQASWLGYFNTTGLKSIDYFISDDFTTPEVMQKFFSERIMRLPNSRFCYAAPDYSPLIALAPSELNGYITFGAFNNVAKLSDSTIRMWSQVLKQVPGSRMLLKWRSYRDKKVREELVERFRLQGVARSRIIIRRDIGHAQMLADYSGVDIVLDTYPFNGGMTSMEALWMGVPIVTLAGNIPASRQTGSFLRLLGLDDCITSSEEGFVTAAVRLAEDRKRLYDIRGTLRQRMKSSPLMDGELFAKDMQALLETMYRESRVEQ